MFGPDSTSSLSINEFGEVIKAKNYFKKLNIKTDKEYRGGISRINKRKVCKKYRN